MKVQLGFATAGDGAASRSRAGHLYIAGRSEPPGQSGRVVAVRTELARPRCTYPACARASSPSVRTDRLLTG